MDKELKPTDEPDRKKTSVASLMRMKTEARRIVIEMVTEEVARVITETVSVPTIGIGSGRFCDGQVLVLHDIIGLYPSFKPQFAKRYVDVGAMIKNALQNFAADVRNGVFPEEQHVFKMEEDQRAKLDSKRKI